MKTRVKKRSLSLLLVIAMVLTLCPINVFAAGENDAEVVSSGKSLGVNYSITSDGVCYIEAVPGSDGEMSNASNFTKGAWVTTNGVKKIVVKEGVTSIGACAFQQSSASEIVLPSTVKEIGYSAFSNCNNLDNLVIPEGVESMGDRALGFMTIKGKLSLPSTLKDCPSLIFNNSTKIKTIEAAEGCCYSVYDGIVYADNGTNAIFIADAENRTGELTFKEGCTKIGSVDSSIKVDKVVLPSSVTTVGKSAFSGCPNLKEVEINCNLSDVAFSGCTALEKVVIKEGVTSITGHTFNKCENIKTIELPKSLTVLDGYAFIGSKSIEKITVAEGGSFAVKDNMLIKDGKEVVLSEKKNVTGHLVIPEGITKIGGAAFTATSITELTLPNTLEEIGGDVFWNCQNLAKVNFGTTNTLKTIGECAFQATALTSVAFPEGVETLGDYVLEGCKSLAEVTFPSTLKALGNKAVSNCTSLKTLEVPVSLGTLVCENCANLTKVTLKEGVTTVGDNAFKNCTSLAFINIPASLKDISSTAFTGCTALKNFDVAEGSSWKTENGLLINGTVLQMVLTRAENVVIPEGVTEICAGLFSGDTTIKTVKLPSTLQVIGDEAFAESTLESVTIPGSVKTVGKNVFSECEDLTKATIEKGAVLGEGEFKECSALVEVSLPEGLEEIPDNCFNECSSIESIDIPSTVKKIGESGFDGCRKLADITLPDGLQELGSEAFSYNAFNSIVIPEGVKYPGECLFRNTPVKIIDIRGAEVIEDDLRAYNNVEKLYLPASLKTMNDTLNMYSKLQVIFYEGSKEQWDAIEGIETVKTNIAKYNTQVVYNYSRTGNGTGDALSITKQPTGGSFVQGLRGDDLTVETNAPEDATIFYNWYEDGKLNLNYQNANTISPSTATEGSKKYYCEVIAVKDGKYSVAKTSEVTYTVIARDGELFKGAGTAEDPYLIETTQDIDNLSAMVSAGETYKDKFFKLAGDVTLLTGWKPIGCTKDGSNDIKSGANMNAFEGTFDGAGHTVTVPAGEKPLFAYVNGATIKNLGIYGEKIEGYGLINNFVGINLSGVGVTVDNVTLKSGTKTLKSGILGGVMTTNGFAASSAGYTCVIKNSTIEKDVVIGYDGNEENIGSFAGRVQGTIENCISYATVKGSNYVGGIVSMKDNTMSELLVKGCTFGGEIIASGSNVGGIIGGGYSNSTAPNAIRASIEGCTVTGTVTGKENVGGIFGGDVYLAQAWNPYHITNNYFCGKVSGEKNVGAIFGFYKSLNKWDDITGNKFMEGCGADKAFGTVEYVDTNVENPTPVKGTTYFSTENSTADCPVVTGCSWKKEHNRADDPLGADASKLAELIKKEAPVSEEVTKAGDLIKKTEKLLADLKDGNNTEEEEAAFVESVIETTKAYEALSTEEKATLASEAVSSLKAAQDKAGEINHKAGDIKVSGIDWNIKINAKLFDVSSEEAKRIEEAAAKDYKNEKVLIIYDLSLTDVLTGSATEPGANGITITLPAPEGIKDFDHVIIAHLRADGVVEYVEAEVKDGEMTFTLKSLSPVAVVGYNKGEVLNEEITSNGDTTPDAAVTTQDATLVKSPVTGDPIAAILFVYATLMILCAGGFVVALRRKAR